MCNPSLSMLLEEHLLSGNMDRCIECTVARVVSGCNLRLLGGWEEKLDEHSYHSCSSVGCYLENFVGRKNTFLNGS